VPLIAFLHGQGGFAVVLAATAAFGAAIFLCSLGFFSISRPRMAISNMAAE